MNRASASPHTEARAPRRSLRRAAAGFSAAFLSALLSGPGASPALAGIEWKGGPFAAAQVEALGRPMVVDVVATWCGPCRQMEKEIWSQPEGAEIVAGRVPYRVDFDSPEGQEVKVRFRVIGLPTVIFLDDTGVEVDRIAGYEEKEKWLAEARRYLGGSSRKAELEAAAEKNFDDPEALVALGAWVLQRGEVERGIGLLERALEKDPANEKGFSDDALFYLGRYYTRAAEDPARGATAWRRLWETWPDGDLSGGAPYWFLLSREGENRLPEGVEEAKAILAARPSRDAALSLASFLADRPAWRREALGILRGQMRGGEEADADLLAMAGEIQLASGMPEIARLYADRALKALPGHPGATELLGKIPGIAPAAAKP